VLALARRGRCGGVGRLIELERKIEQGLGTFVEVGEALMEIKTMLGRVPYCHRTSRLYNTAMPGALGYG
jgi:hypothetical protein